MKNIFLITDYKKNFGSKFNSIPYRSGFDKNLLSDLFKSAGYQANFIKPSEVGYSFEKFRDEIVLFTSQEDSGLFYKSYLEDIIYLLELNGAKIVPSFTLFLAHENKVFFEIFRTGLKLPELNNLNARWFGTFEEYNEISDELTYPIVIKSFHGSKSRKVVLAKTSGEAEEQVKKISKSGNTRLKIWDNIRYLIHKGYIKESWNRKKFIVQKFIPGLVNDFKILIFGFKYYVLKRENKKGDFRASGQGHLSFTEDLPEGLLDYAEKCFNVFNTPQASFDIGFNGKEYFLFEAQFVYFGTYTIEYSEFYFIRKEKKWICTVEKSCVEKEYVDSIISFISE
jgi:glutathione synthase/RimK-type ligase-like ATP-grasp enzyme